MKLVHSISSDQFVMNLTELTKNFMTNLGRSERRSASEFSYNGIQLWGVRHSVTSDASWWITLVTFNGTVFFDSFHKPSPELLTDMIINLFEGDDGEAFLNELHGSDDPALASVHSITVDIWEEGNNLPTSSSGQLSFEESDNDSSDIQTVMVVVGAVGAFCLIAGFTLAEKRRRLALVNEEEKHTGIKSSEGSWDTDSTPPPNRQNNISFVPQLNDCESSICSSIALSHKFSRCFDEESCCNDQFEYIWKGGIDRAIPASPSQNTVVTENRSPLVITQADTDGVTPRTPTRRCCINSAL